MLPSRLHARRQMLKVLYPVKEVPTEAAGKKRNTKEIDMTDKLFERDRSEVRRPQRWLHQNRKDWSASW